VASVEKFSAVDIGANEQNHATNNGRDQDVVKQVDEITSGWLVGLGT